MKRGSANLYAIITAFLMILFSSILLTSYSVVEKTILSLNYKDFNYYKINNFNKGIEVSVKKLFADKTNFNIGLSDLSKIKDNIPSIVIEELKLDKIVYSLNYYDEDTGYFLKKISEHELYFKLRYILSGKDMMIENCIKIFVKKDTKTNTISVEVEKNN